MELKLRSRYNVENELDCSAEQLVGIATTEASYSAAGHVEVLQARVERLEEILGRILARVALTPKDALEIAGIYRWVENGKV